MAKSRTRRARKQRRQLRVFLKTGKKPSHKLRAGRTGHVHAKKLKSRRQND